MEALFLSVCMMTFAQILNINTILNSKNVLEPFDIKCLKWNGAFIFSTICNWNSGKCA